MSEKWERIKSVLDDTNCYCDIKETEALVEFWTDYAGQDIPIEFYFDGTVDDFVKQFAERAENYDVDEEVALYVPMRGKNGIPSSIVDIVRDCQEAKDTLMEIASRLEEVLND